MVCIISCLQGKIDRAVLEAAELAQEETAASGVPTEVINRRAEYVYDHKPGLFPGAYLLR